MKEQLKTKLEHILEQFNAQVGTIHRLNMEDDHLYLLESIGIPPQILAITEKIPLGKGIAGETAKAKKPVKICNLQTDTGGIAKPGAKCTGAQGTLCVPIFRDEEVVGTLGVGVIGDRDFNEIETEHLIAIGRTLAAHL